MGWPFGYAGQCGCNCAAVATLTLTLKGCDNSLRAGVAVTLTQGGSTVTATTNGSGVATFSLPATGTWTWTHGAVTGYTSAGGTITGIVAGANTRAVNLAVDFATSGYFCDGCGNAVLSLTFTYNGFSAGTRVETVSKTFDGMIGGAWFTGDPTGSGSLHGMRFVFGSPVTPNGGTGWQIWTGAGAPGSSADTTPPTYLLDASSSHTCSPYSWTYPNDGAELFGGTLTH